MMFNDFQRLFANFNTLLQFKDILRFSKIGNMDSPSLIADSCLVKLGHTNFVYIAQVGTMT